MIGGVAGVEEYPVRSWRGGSPGSVVVRSVRRGRSSTRPRWLPGASERYRNSWRNGDVARQMLELTDRQLLHARVCRPVYGVSRAHSSA